MLVTKRIYFPSDKTDFAILLKVTLYKSYLGAVRTYSGGYPAPSCCVVAGPGAVTNLQCQLEYNQSKRHIFRRGPSDGIRLKEGDRISLSNLHMLGKDAGFPQMFIHSSMAGRVC